MVAFTAERGPVKFVLELKAAIILVHRPVIQYRNPVTGQIRREDNEFM